ncbi:hypothetical protein EC973_000546 [Apophysomyces ossiformis]|uniref:DH domain-containing protein n=1 Tax=Apophysomyces ossiformis TaxID=679940 RepID=A0A8H7ENS2_9FUNG|nr:hypothetical protein EC973_000546 [Apophysomyces ossiformis]
MDGLLDFENADTDHSPLDNSSTSSSLFTRSSMVSRPVVHKPIHDRNRLPFIPRAGHGTTITSTHNTTTITTTTTPFSPPPSPRKSSTRHFFGRSDLQRKEVKAVALWHHVMSRYHHEDITPQRPLTVKDAALAKFVILELYTTEKSYHRLLSMIQTKYAEPMEAASKIKDPLIKPSDLPALFRHLPDMIKLSEKILDYFEPNPVWRDMQPVQVGRVFRQLENDLVIFLRYATHYQTYLKTIRRACNSVFVLKIEQVKMPERE